MDYPSGMAVAAAGVDRPRGAPKVVIVDSDSGFVRVLVKRLESRGWRVTVLDGAQVEELIKTRQSVVLVDPETLGSARWQFLEELGRDAPELSVIVCTGPSSVADRIRGLHLAADDWVTKPCHPHEVMARIEAILRRRSQATERLMKEPTHEGELEIRPDRYDAFVRGSSVGLTRREFELLQALVGARGSVLEREEIYLQIWGYRMVRGDRSVDVFVRKLRQKIEDRSPTWCYIHTHLGVGYRFEPQPQEAPPSRGQAADQTSAAGSR
jgi:DNA-binding response OmpR family regulator